MIETMDYSEYWEKCWKAENAEELFHYLNGWNGFSDREMEIFKNYSVQSVCDAACGFGAHALAFASNGFQVSAFDISKEAANLTKLGLTKYGYGSVEVREAGITDTGYEDGSFDAVTAYAVIDHLTQADARKALAELMRITKAGGLLLLSFDAAEEDDYLCAHEMLADGSMLYKQDTPRSGMIFRPYDSERMESLLQGYHVMEQWTNRKGCRIVILSHEEKGEHGSR